MVSVMFSPCHLASIPLIVAYVAGQETAVNSEAGKRCMRVHLPSGLFVTIALVGMICAWLGRLLGDLGPLVAAAGGLLILIWVALGMLGVQACTLSGSMLYRLKLRGVHGAFGSGFGLRHVIRLMHLRFYRSDSGSGNRPARMDNRIADDDPVSPWGIVCRLPIAGSSMAMVRKLNENHTWLETGNWFRRCAGVLIGLMGIYFIARPFLIEMLNT
jgi:cytochrome c-type biogenesis protein